MDASPHQNATLLSPNTNLGLRVPTGSRTLHILLSIAQVAFLAGPRFPGRRAIASLTILGLLVGSQINPYFTDDLATAQPFSIEWATTLSVVEKILFAGPDGPEGSFWHIDKPVGEALAFSAFSFDKLKWALVLMVNMRGIRWNFQVKNVPPMKKTTRWNFVVTQCLNLVYFAFMADLFTQLGIRLFYTTPNGPPPDSKYLKLGHDDWRWSFLKAFVFGATPYYMLSMQYTMMSIPFVALHLSAPEDWPAHFGRLVDATTVRDFWGKYWHQTVRRLFNAWTGAFVDFVGIKRGTNASSYTQLWLAFVVSGLFHANAMRGIPAPANITVDEYTTGWIQFFVLQAAAITFEDFVQWCWRQLGGKTTGPSVLRTLVGYVWVTCWIWYSLPLVGDLMLRMRVGEAAFLPFSVAESWMKYIPLP